MRDAYPFAVQISIWEFADYQLAVTDVHVTVLAGVITPKLRWR